MTSSSRLRFDIEDAPSEADVEVLPNGLEAFNESRWPGHQQWQPLAVFARDGESIVAGLAGEPIPAGSSSATYGSVTRCEARGLDGSSWAAPRPVRSSAAAIRPGSTPSASRRRDSIPGSATRCSANWTIRPDTSASSCRSGLRVRREARLRVDARQDVQFCARPSCFSLLGSLFCNCEQVSFRVSIALLRPSAPSQISLHWQAVTAPRDDIAFEDPRIPHPRFSAWRSDGNGFVVGRSASGFSRYSIRICLGNPGGCFHNCVGARSKIGGPPLLALPFRH
jgi:hypothetical protein